jgi:hypothetical protein
MATRVKLRDKEEQAFLVTSARLVIGEGEEFGRVAYEKLYLAASRGSAHAAEPGSRPSRRSQPPTTS